MWCRMGCLGEFETQEQQRSRCNSRRRTGNGLPGKLVAWVQTEHSRGSNLEVAVAGTAQSESEEKGKWRANQIGW